MRPETFGVFAAKVAKYGAWRPRANLQKPAIGGHFFYFRGQILAAPDWLADLGGFELPYYHSKKRL